jgi:hypothetical protein
MTSVVVVNSDGSRSAFTLNLLPDDSIESVKTKVSEKINLLDDTTMNVLFCGKALCGDTKIKSLDLGPLTYTKSEKWTDS